MFEREGNSLKGAATVTRSHIGLLSLSGVMGAALLMLLSLCVGSTGFENLLAAIGSKDAEQARMAWHIVSEIRLPRTLGAWLAGALLGLAGALAQGLFRNPLADPYLLGSAAGASLGVALVLAALGGGAGMLGGGTMNGGLALSLFSSSLWLRMGLTGAAFVGAVSAVLLTLVLAQGAGQTLRLLLSGVVVGVVLSAATQLLLLLSPDSLQAMQAFVLGSVAFVDWPAVGLMGAVWGLSCVCAVLLARALDGLSLGEHTASSLGLPVLRLRVALVLLLALSTGTAVAQTGLIAFVGLAAPHVVRSLVQSTHAALLILSSLTGGALLLVADILARGLLAPQELPVGVLTAVLGGGYLLWLMHRGHAKTGAES